MRRIRTILAICVLLLISGCGPVYRTNYSFSPPENANGRACIFQCENSKLQCRQIEDLEHERCEDRSEREYDRCQDRNQGRREDKRQHCYRSWCASASYKQCESTYRQCYQSCGGTVSSQRVCVSFCDQAK